MWQLWNPSGPDGCFSPNERGTAVRQVGGLPHVTKRLSNAVPSFSPVRGSGTQGKSLCSVVASSSFRAAYGALLVVVVSLVSLPALAGSSEGSVLSAAGITTASEAVASSERSVLRGAVSKGTFLQSIAPHDNEASGREMNAEAPDLSGNNVIAMANAFNHSIVEPVAKKAGETVAMIAADVAAAVSAAGGAAAPVNDGGSFIQTNANVLGRGAGESAGLFSAGRARVLRQKLGRNIRASNKQELNTLHASGNATRSSPPTSVPAGSTPGAPDSTAEHAKTSQIQTPSSSVAPTLHPTPVPSPEQTQQQVQTQQPTQEAQQQVIDAQKQAEEALEEAEAALEQAHKAQEALGQATDPQHVEQVERAEQALQHAQEAQQQAQELQQHAQELQQQLQSEQEKHEEQLPQDIPQLLNQGPAVTPGNTVTPSATTAVSAKLHEMAVQQIEQLRMQQKSIDIDMKHLKAVASHIAEQERRAAEVLEKIECASGNGQGPCDTDAVYTMNTNPRPVERPYPTEQTIDTPPVRQAQHHLEPQMAPESASPAEQEATPDFMPAAGVRPMPERAPPAETVETPESEAPVQGEKTTETASPDGEATTFELTPPAAGARPMPVPAHPAEAVETPESQAPVEGEKTTETASPEEEATTA
ncbi:hypothetical protein TGARI_318880, partial [Toxoplasma gondii ARI]